jgi:shikimate dehydrogenase
MGLMDSLPPLSSRTRTLAIIGSPIDHSITPRIQNFALREIAADIVNVAFRVEPANLQAAVLGARALGLLGLMVTIPHKEAVLKLCTRLDDSARAMGAANLLHFAQVEIVGHSTDGWAAIQSLAEEGVSVRGASIAILGGGGAARSLALTFAKHGARHITLLNRSVERATIVAAEVEQSGVSASADSLASCSAPGALDDFGLLVNATSLGMHPREYETPVSAAYLRPGLAVYDIVYNPLETRLLREARAAGARTVDGLGMLIYTNVAAVKICAGLDIAAPTMRAEALRALGS